MSRVNLKVPHVVFIPFPAQSHIKCMLKLARLLHHKGVHITFVNTQTNHTRLLESGGTRWLDDTPGFQFKTVPDGVKESGTIAEIWTYLGTHFYDPFLEIVSGLETAVTCIICDGFMTYTNMIFAAEKLRVPLILFWTMAACGFMGFCQGKDLLERGLIPLKGNVFPGVSVLQTEDQNRHVILNKCYATVADESYLTNGFLDTEIDWIPGMEGIRLKDLPEFILPTKPDDPVLKYHLETALTAHKVSHIIIHTFEELEASLVKHIKSIFPNVYTIGPLQLLLNQMTENQTKNSYSNGYSLWKEEPECVQWLQSKEPNSVVYVNFGSLAVMSLQNLQEFGWGLVNSNHYFLWIIRNDLVKGEPVVLPQELKEAMNKKGFIASWCSQEEVLNHPSVGGFLTHGGWGSIIESLSAGVPMICWPYSGDQRTNCRQMCKEWEVGMEIGSNVKRDEVEKLIRELMEGTEGERMKKKALEWKKMAEMATSSHGSSFLDIEKLANEVTKLL